MNKFGEPDRLDHDLLVSDDGYHVFQELGDVLAAPLCVDHDATVE